MGDPVTLTELPLRGQGVAGTKLPLINLPPQIRSDLVGQPGLSNEAMRSIRRSVESVHEFPLPCEHP